MRKDIEIIDCYGNELKVSKSKTEMILYFVSFIGIGFTVSYFMAREIFCGTHCLQEFLY